MGEAVIVSTARTAIGTARKGTLADLSAADLAVVAVGGLLERAGVPAEYIDDVQMGESLQGGGDLARYTAVELGLLNVPGVALQRHCASGMAAVQGAAGSVMAGMDKVVIAAGTESISTTPGSIKRHLPGDEMGPWMSASHRETPDAPAWDMSITVGWNTAQRADVSRLQMDEWSYESHRRAISAIDDGRFEEEIVPFEVTRRDGTTTMFQVDEHPRRETTLEKLAGLKPIHPEIEGFSITAGNSSGLNDAAAAIMICDSEFAKAHGLVPLAVIKSWANAALAPRDTGLGPVYAIPKALERAGLSVEDMDLVEINEAFASMAVASTRMLGFDHDIVNVNGSGCSLGHPIAATGARMVVTLINELRRRGGGLGVASMCAAGGMGSATVLEVMPG